MKIKICGLRRVEDIESANELLPDYSGFILSPGFKRSISSGEFISLYKNIGKNIKTVGVFVNESIGNILRFSGMLDVIQLHGSENEEYITKLKQKTSARIWKAVRAKSCEDISKACCLPCDKLVIDSYVKGAAGGSGVKIDTSVFKGAKISKPFFLAGGIDSQNISSVLKEAKSLGAEGIDISSGAETNGYKDKLKMSHLIKTVRDFR